MTKAEVEKRIYWHKSDYIFFSAKAQHMDSVKGNTRDYDQKASEAKRRLEHWQWMLENNKFDPEPQLNSDAG